MRVAIVLLGLGLPLLSPVLAGDNEWVELTYEGAECWVLDVPGADGGRALYCLSAAAPLEGEPWGYAECCVGGYDEDLGTLTLSCAGAEDLELEFEFLSEWLNGDPPATAGAELSAFPSDVTCEGGSCACDGKCWVCCAKGFVPSCSCAGSGVCVCIPAEELAGGGSVY